MKHTTSARFWALYEALPKTVQAVADKNFELLKSDPRHPSLHFKRLGKVWSVRVGEHHRAPGHDVSSGSNGFGSGVTLNMTASPTNNALERAVAQRGRAVLAIDRVLGGAELAPCQAAQLGR